MMSDVIFEAIEEMNEYKKEKKYADEKFTARYDVVVKLMEALGISLAAPYGEDDKMWRKYTKDFVCPE